MKQTRATKQKGIIIEVLKKYQDHVTADQVYQGAKRLMQGIGVATIYRNLENMSASGLIDSIYIAGHPKWYEVKKSGYHGHTFCEQCGELKDIASCSLCLVKNQAKEMADFEGRDFKFLIIGKCGKCLVKK